MKTGYSIKTWKMRLFCPEKQMIETTEALYREAVAFYYELLKEREELWAENLLTIQGHLEKLTVPGRDGGKLRCPDSKGTNAGRHQSMQRPFYQYGQLCSMHSSG